MTTPSDVLQRVALPIAAEVDTLDRADLDAIDPADDRRPGKWPMLA